MKKTLALVLVLFVTTQKTSAADEKPAKKKEPDNPQVERIVQNMLDRFDTNKDGKISKEEAKGKLAENFDRLDVNKDGFLDKDELRRAARVMVANQAKGENAKPGPNPNRQANIAAAKDFDALDRNADGRLSREELKGTEFADHFDEMDTNKDGTIDQKEFRTYLKKKAEKEEDKKPKK
jgi:Ca2+-binding EF-hand superfamily protein